MVTTDEQKKQTKEGCRGWWETGLFHFLVFLQFMWRVRTAGIDSPVFYLFPLPEFKKNKQTNKQKKPHSTMHWIGHFLVELLDQISVCVNRTPTPWPYMYTVCSFLLKGLLQAWCLPFSWVSSFNLCWQAATVSLTPHQIFGGNERLQQAHGYYQIHHSKAKQISCILWWSVWLISCNLLQNFLFFFAYKNYNSVKHCT